MFGCVCGCRLSLLSGTEEFNTIERNLIIQVRPSEWLTSSDVLSAGILLRNPRNFVRCVLFTLYMLHCFMSSTVVWACRGNVVTGSTHFGILVIIDIKDSLVVGNGQASVCPSHASILDISDNTVYRNRSRHLCIVVQVIVRY